MRFRSIDDLKKQLVRIVGTEHGNLGGWTTAQIFCHLAAAFEVSLDATPSPAGYPRTVRWIVRPFRWLVTRIRFPPGLPIPAAIAFRLDPPPDAEVTEQYERLVTAVDRFDNCRGPLPPHPVLGPLTRSEWTGFHLRHCEHHLSFIRLADVVQPRGAGTGKRLD